MEVIDVLEENNVVHIRVVTILRHTCKIAYNIPDLNSSVNDDKSGYIYTYYQVDNKTIFKHTQCKTQVIFNRLPNELTDYT